ncbi:hypothetical protein AUJ77_00520 [Candidatus Nomurabacteria bacterium CG1_02_43_90]|uniref:Uncharacterized protein n=1 Tax=Candidatus Nomurabacteria bacterium CG1_02_43_90 TaxID=1805281 RepID=A0A1J4V1Y8_9BACT|nr:MAG: hypothetical protein AUJ77_00520 [Candidatus Nomurabacteria bacterium CG1_02_43_90]
MNNIVLVSVGGPEAALSAMESVSIGQYLCGENLGDPATLFEVQETRIEAEEDDFLAVSSAQGLVEKPHRPRVFFQYYHLRGRKACLEEVLSLTRGRSVPRNEVAQRKYPQYYEGVRIH